MKISIAQNNIYWEDLDKNLESILNKIQRSGEKGADLIIFPEMTLSGFSMNASHISLPPSNKYFDAIYDKATKASISVVFGAAVKENNKYYNRLLAINSQKSSKMHYDKIHPFSFSDEHKYYTSGKSIHTFYLNGYQWCGYICYDLRFPEIFIKVAEKVDLFIVIANWPHNRIEHWEALLRARSLDTLSYVIGVNRTGSAPNEIYSGKSMVFSPWGELLYDAKEKGLSHVEIDLSQVQQVRNRFSLLKDRCNLNHIAFKHQGPR